MPEKRPNFLVIVADDLGFSDIGCFGSEIRTPNIDKLAKKGQQFTDFHAAAACSPTRAMIMTGTDHHIAGLGNLIEWTAYTGQNTAKGVNQSTAPQRGMPGYEGYLNERVAALPEILRDGGYHTMMAGKWHLGFLKERSPWARGFDKSFAHMPACSNHYGFEPQLEEADPPRFLEASYIALHMEDDQYVKKLPEGWYSSNGYADKLVNYLDEYYTEKEKEENKDQDKPFFAYLPFTAPHWPLQAPQEYIKNYRGVYDEGPDKLRETRLRRLQELGLVGKDVKPHPVVADEVAEWKDMSQEERIRSSRAMEVFAGMVECIDANVGKVVDYLESKGELDNTFVCFMSDNGAEGAAYETYPIVQGNVLDHLRKYYDNSLENLGNYNSFIWYGPRWAQAATAPSRLYKAYTTEGGIRVPFVIKYPQNAQVEVKKPVIDQFATVMDLAPTILEMAGIKHPAPTYKGREIVPMRGKSWLPWLTGSSDRIHEVDFIQGWETSGRAGIRKGNWKAVYIPAPKGPNKWQLYNLDQDAGELDDLAEKEPKKLEELLGHYDEYVKSSGIIPLNPDLGEFIEATEAQMPENGWMEYEYWHKGAREEGQREKFFNQPPRFPPRPSHNVVG